ncbi:transcription cofactor vestigial-like protein 1 isoform X2 [Ochotona princeps]|nr:transcription cofactor vestigial-like protein 1 isoform X2 [Ochotona princeps]
MEEMRKTDGQQARRRQRPVKTEWSSNCVIFNYFQGDIGSVVDEHFARALSNIRSPQRLITSSMNEDVILRNDGDMPPYKWRFPSWTNSQPEGFLANDVGNYSSDVSVPVAVDQHPLTLTGTTSAQPTELWHFAPTASSSRPEAGYSNAVSTGCLVPERQSDGKYKKTNVHRNRGSANTSQANERNQSPERRKDMF